MARANCPILSVLAQNVPPIRFPQRHSWCSRNVSKLFRRRSVNVDSFIHRTTRQPTVHERNRRGVEASCQDTRCHEYWFGLVWFGLVSLPSPDLFSLAAPVKCPRHLWLYTFQFASNNPTRAISHPQLNNRPSGALSRHPQSQTYPFQPLPTFLPPPSQASRPLAGSANRAVGT